MSKKGFHEAEYARGELDWASDDHLPAVTRLPLWRRAVEWARDINAEATQTQKAKALALGLGSAIVGGLVSRQIVEDRRQTT